MEHLAILVFTLDMLVFLDYSYRDVILVLGILLFLRVIFFPGDIRFVMHSQS